MRNIDKIAYKLIDNKIFEVLDFLDAQIQMDKVLKDKYRKYIDLVINPDFYDKITTDNTKLANLSQEYCFTKNPVLIFKIFNLVEVVLDYQDYKLEIEKKCYPLVTGFVPLDSTYFFILFGQLKKADSLKKEKAIKLIKQIKSAEKGDPDDPLFYLESLEFKYLDELEKLLNIYDQRYMWGLNDSRELLNIINSLNIKELNEMLDLLDLEDLVKIANGPHPLLSYEVDWEEMSELDDLLKKPRKIKLLSEEQLLNHAKYQPNWLGRFYRSLNELFGFFDPILDEFNK